MLAFPHHIDLPRWYHLFVYLNHGQDTCSLSRISDAWTSISLVQPSHSVMSSCLGAEGLQHARLLHPTPTPRACSNSCPPSQWCHPTISPFFIPFSSFLQSFPSSGSFQMSQFFTSSSQSIGASASALVRPMNIQDWFPLDLTGLISLQSKGLSGVFSNTTVQKRKFFRTWLSL